MTENIDFISKILISPTIAFAPEVFQYQSKSNDLSKQMVCAVPIGWTQESDTAKYEKKLNCHIQTGGCMLKPALLYWIIFYIFGTFCKRANKRKFIQLWDKVLHNREQKHVKIWIIFFLLSTMFEKRNAKTHVRQRHCSWCFVHDSFCKQDVSKIWNILQKLTNQVMIISISVFGYQRMDTFNSTGFPRKNHRKANKDNSFIL